MIVIDMDMPLNCRECHLRQRSEKYMGENYCMGMLGKPIKSDIFTKRADFCPIKCDIEDIKAEIEAIDVTMGIKDYPFIPKAKVLDIIDKYREEQTDAT